MMDAVLKVLFVVMCRGYCDCVDFQSANWESCNSRDILHPQNVCEINMGSRKDDACFFVRVFMLF